MQKLSSERLKDSAINFKFLTASAEEIPLKTESIDTVVCTYTLCSISKPELALIEINRILKKYLKYSLLLWIVSIKDNVTIKNGFIISMGWNLGKKNKSNHLFDPLTSIPMKGTNNKLTNAIKNKIIENFVKIFWFKNEKSIKIKIAKVM